MKKLIPILLIIALTLSGCKYSGKGFTATAFYFDTVITITLYEKNSQLDINACFDLAEKYENMLSATKEGSEIYKINNNPGNAIYCSDETIELLLKGIEYEQLTDGRFSIFCGSVTNLWDFSGENNNIPSSKSLEEACKSVGANNVIIEGNFVTLTNTATKINLGGIAKGFVADEMVHYLHSIGVKSGVINLGGNVYVMGSKPIGDNPYYTIGVQKPFSTTGESICALSLKNKTMVTSGCYERYFTKNNKLYHHILDLTTGMPVENNLYSVTIITNHSVDADALSTIAYIYGLDDGLKLIESIENTEAIFITSDYEIITTEGLSTNDITIEYQ